MTTSYKPKPKRPKALWYRARYGDKPRPRPVRRIRPVSKGRASLLRAYAAKARAWKAGRLCATIGLRDSQGELWCSSKSHLCDHVHHTKGRVGPLLMDETKWLGLCDASHRRTHDNPAEAKEKGLIAEGWNHQPKEAA